jgi:hypothetical protein
MAKRNNSWGIKNHPSLFGMDITSKKSLFLGAVLILTGILAPVGIIIFLMGGMHRTKKKTQTKKRSR